MSAQESRDAALFDAVVTAAALVAQADGWIDQVERQRLPGLIRYLGAGTAFSDAEILGAFEAKLQRLQEPGGAAMAVDCLGRLADGSHHVVEVAQQMALADDDLHQNEARMLQLIRATLAARHSGQ